MNYAIYDLNTGLIQRVLTCSHDAVLTSFAEGEGYLGVPSEVDDSNHYIDNGAAVPFPEKPDGFFKWDYQQKSWVHDAAAEAEFQQEELVRLKNKKVEDIEKRRVEILNSPLTHNAHTIVATVQEQKLLHDKLTELRTREELGMENTTQLFWRDVNGELITFEMQSTFRTWLMQVTVILSDRRTATNELAVQKKALANNATTFEELASISWD